MFFPLYGKYIDFISIPAGLSSLFASHLLLAEVNTTAIYVARTGNFGVKDF